MTPEKGTRKMVNLSNSFHLDVDYAKPHKNKLTTFLDDIERDKEETKAHENSSKQIGAREMDQLSVDRESNHAGIEVMAPVSPVPRRKNRILPKKSQVVKSKMVDAIERKRTNLFGRITALGASSYLMSMNTLRHPRVVQWVTRSSYLRFSVIFSGLSVLWVLLSSKNILCNQARGYQAVVALAWIITAYFSWEAIIVVDYLQPDLHCVL